MRMYEKLKTLKDKLQKMKSNRANRQTGQTFHFSPFSRKQKQVLTWWCKESPVLIVRYVGHEHLHWSKLCYVRKDHRILPAKCSVLAEADASVKRIFHHGSQGR